MADREVHLEKEDIWLSDEVKVEEYEEAQPLENVKVGKYFIDSSNRRLSF